MALLKKLLKTSRVVTFFKFKSPFIDAKDKSCKKIMWSENITEKLLHAFIRKIKA